VFSHYFCTTSKRESRKGKNKVQRLSDERVDFAFFKSDIDQETEEGYYGVADWKFTWDE
jgi:hypothetical protein